MPAQLSHQVLVLVLFTDEFSNTIPHLGLSTTKYQPQKGSAVYVYKHLCNSWWLSFATSCLNQLRLTKILVQQIQPLW